MFAVRRARRDHRAIRAWLLALALVGGQALGLVHAVRHAHAHVALSSALTKAFVSADAAHDASAGDPRTDDAYGHASGTAACVLWSGVLGGDTAAFDTPAHAAADPAANDLAFGDDGIASRDAARAYDARGPPAA